MAADRKYDTWPSEKRYAEAKRLIREEGWSARKASEHLGISRAWLRDSMRKDELVHAEQQARSDLAREERLTPERKTEERPLLVQGETRRVPPIGEFVRMYFDGLKCPRHNIHHEIPAYQDEIMAKIVDPEVKRLLINVPPGHSKSTCGTVFTTVYEVCRDPNTQIAVMSATTRMAERFLRQIKQFLTDEIVYKDSTRNLIEDWGPFVDSRNNLGSAKEFYVAGRQSAERDPTVSSYGLGQQIQGVRMDRIICDDIAVLDNQKNPDRVADMELLVTQDLMTRLDETGQLCIIGTRVLPGDVYAPLLDLPAFEVIRYPCIIDEDKRQTLWPEHFNFEAAERQRGSMSAEQWELVFQNSPLAGIGASFTPEQLERCHDLESSIGFVPPNVMLVAGLDPGGANEQAGYTSMVLMGVDVNSGVHFLVDLVNVKQMKAPQILDQIRDWATKYPQLRELRVETNGFAAQIYQYNLELQSFLGNRGIRLAPHITHGHNKWDPQFGVEAMAPMFHNQVIKIPWGDLWSRRQFTQLTDQLVRFPAGKPDDLVMACWFAWLGCKELYQRQAMPAFDARKVLPARVRHKRRVWESGAPRAPTTEETSGTDLFGRQMRPMQERQLRNRDGIVLF